MNILKKIALNFIQTNLFLNQTNFIKNLFENGFLNWYYVSDSEHIEPNGEWWPKEIDQWWLIDKECATLLKKEKEAILSYEDMHWWGRCSSSKDLVNDPLRQKIATHKY